jgi:hypothetical protein
VAQSDGLRSSEVAPGQAPCVPGVRPPPASSLWPGEKEGLGIRPRDPSQGRGRTKLGTVGDAPMVPRSAHLAPPLLGGRGPGPRAALPAPPGSRPSPAPAPPRAPPRPRPPLGPSDPRGAPRAGAIRADGRGWALCARPETPRTPAGSRTPLPAQPSTQRPWTAPLPARERARPAASNPAPSLWPSLEVQRGDRQPAEPATTAHPRTPASSRTSGHGRAEGVKQGAAGAAQDAPTPVGRGACPAPGRCRPRRPADGTELAGPLSPEQERGAQRRAWADGQFP